MAQAITEFGEVALEIRQIEHGVTLEQSIEAISAWRASVPGDPPRISGA
jgi:hypothetical protein